MSAGKGDTPRAVNGEVFRRNYDSIFAENLEQARLLAMSADREDKLRTDLMLAQKLAESAMLESDRLRAQLHKQ